MMSAHTRERLAFGVFPDLAGVEFLSGWHVSENFDAHLHDDFTIGVILEGSERFRCRGEEYLAGPGTIAVLNPGDVHKGGPGPQGWWTYRMIYPSPGLMTMLCDDIVGSRRGMPSFPSVLVADDSLGAALAELHEAVLNAGSTLERQTMLFRALAALIARHATFSPSLRLTGAEPQAVARVRRHLEENYQSVSSLDELSMLSGLSPFYLLRVFHREVGMPPHAYLRHVRVARAKTMLAQGLPVAQVAAAAGFSDQSHLTRQFKRIVGITPGVYSRAISFKT